MDNIRRKQISFMVQQNHDFPYFSFLVFWLTPIAWYLWRKQHINYWWWWWWWSLTMMPVQQSEIIQSLFAPCIKTLFKIWLHSSPLNTVDYWHIMKNAFIWDYNYYYFREGDFPAFWLSWKKFEFFDSESPHKISLKSLKQNFVILMSKARLS